MKFNIIYNKEILNYEKVLENLENILSSKNILYKTFEIKEMENFGDFSFVIGGDGTILKAARFYSQAQIPILGINIGRLGYLSQIQANEAEMAVEKVVKRDFYLENRVMLQSDTELALNDFVIKGCKSTRTSKFYLEINDKFVCEYIADGLIISTPTGSTAYGLSAGGPILYPTLNAITIVPICPHSLNVRPLVIPLEEKITVKSADEKLLISADGEEGKEFKQIAISVAPNQAKLAFLKNEKFYSVLRNKLHWGIAPTYK